MSEQPREHRFRDTAGGISEWSEWSACTRFHLRTESVEWQHRYAGSDVQATAPLEQGGCLGCDAVGGSRVNGYCPSCRPDPTAPPQREKWPERTYYPIPKNGIEWAIDFFEYRDRMNAQIHCQTPTWSPITVQIRADYAQAALDRAKVLAVESVLRGPYITSESGRKCVACVDVQRALAGPGTKAR